MKYDNFFKMSMEDHKDSSSYFDWDELVNIIIVLEMEFHYFKDEMSKKDHNKLKKIINIYSQRKEHILVKTFEKGITNLTIEYN